MSANEPTRPSGSFEAVTASNSTNFVKGVCRGIYVGTTGNVVVVAPDDTTATFIAVPAGAVLPVQAKRVNSTSTTASNMVALF